MCLFVGAIAFSACASDDEPIERVCDEPTAMRIERVTLPNANVSATVLGFDLDGDEDVDNQLGLLAGALQNFTPGLDLSTAITAKLGSELEWYVAITPCADGQAEVAFALTKDVAHLVHLTGTIDETGRVVASGDDGVLPLSAMFDPTASYDRPGWLRSRISRIEATQLPDGSWQGRIAMAFTHAEMFHAITAPLAEFFTDEGLFLTIFDKNPTDGTITVEEMREAPILHSLLKADLGEPGDGWLSFGFGFSAR